MMTERLDKSNVAKEAASPLQHYVPVIIGVVVAVVVAVLILLIFYFCVWRKGKKGEDAELQNFTADQTTESICGRVQFREVHNEKLLPELEQRDAAKKCLVIDLDETLVHSSFKPISNADFIVPVEVDGSTREVYFLKRPHVDEFLRKMGELYECVLFTASLAKYADPVCDLLDTRGEIFRSRLFREHCVFHRGNYVKDLARLGRDLDKTIIIDNNPASYIFQPDNAVPVVSWYDDMKDRELLDLIPFLELLSKVDNIYGEIRGVKMFGV